MTILNFTAEEINLIAIYKAETLEETLERIDVALPDMDAEMRTIAESARRKLAELSEQEFIAASFSPAEDTDEE